MIRLKSLVAKLGIAALRLSGLYTGYWNHWRLQLFDYAEARGLHILPVHYYSPIPAQADFARKRRASNLAGVDLDILGATERVNSLLETHYDALAKFFNNPTPYDPNNQGFNPLDAAILFALISEIRPKRIVEIGSGMSTTVMSAALKNVNSATSLTCIEPFLPDYLKGKQDFITQVIERPLQEVDLEIFKSLDAGDMLFIDSTHVVRFDSDVLYEILEILPILKPGVIVHVHDIFLPDDYPESWLKKYRFFWTEQYMLLAFLSMNPNFRIDIPVHAIKGALSEKARRLPVINESNTPPGSLWMRRI